jgi:hypothetical protein
MKMEKAEESFKEIQDKINYKRKMRKNKEMQNEIHFALIRKPLSKTRESGVFGKIGKSLKTLGCLGLLAGMGLIFNSCADGYYGSDVSYMEYNRSPEPGGTHIWIEGNWNYNSRTHAYVQRAGNWESPRQGHSYVAGHWQTNQHGKSWSKGYWQKDKSRNGKQHNNQRDNQNDRHNR